MSIRWGVSPIAWANDDLPALGGDTALATILSDARAIGFDGIELGHLFPRDAGTLEAVLRDHHLALIGGWWGLHLLDRDADAEIAAMERHLTLLEAMGCSVCIVAETSNAIHADRTRPMTEAPRLAAEEWTTFGARLDRLAAHVAARGMRLAYHHHLGTVVETAADLERLFAATGPEVGLVLDTGHALYGGIDPIATLRARPERIVHVHCKDVRAHLHAATVARAGSFLDGVIAGMFTTPGDGGYDYAPFLRALREIGYAGWIVIEAEQDPAIADPRIYGAAGLGLLQRLAEAVGLA